MPLEIIYVSILRAICKAHCYNQFATHCKDAYASVRRYKDTVAHVDQSDLESRFNGKIVNSDLRTTARSK
jgi:hypothetical protein